MKYLNQINFLMAIVGCAVVVFSLSQTVWTEKNRVSIVVPSDAPYEGPAVVTRAPSGGLSRTADGIFPVGPPSPAVLPPEAQDEDSLASDEASRIESPPGASAGQSETIIPQASDRLREALRGANVVQAGERPAAVQSGGSQPAAAATESPQQQRFAPPAEQQRATPPFVQGTESQKRQPAAGSPPPVRGSLLEQRPPR